MPDMGILSHVSFSGFMVTSIFIISSCICYGIEMFLEFQIFERLYQVNPMVVLNLRSAYGKT